MKGRAIKSGDAPGATGKRLDAEVASMEGRPTKSGDVCGDQHAAAMISPR